MKKKIKNTYIGSLRSLCLKYLQGLCDFCVTIVYIS